MSRTVSVPAARIERWLDTYWVRHGHGPVTASDDSVVVAGTDGATARLRLLWPGAELGDYPLADLVAAAHSPRRLGLLAVRADGHAVGLWDGAAVTSSKRRGHYVQSRTAAGGWSQQRFARRRENQARRRTRRLPAMSPRSSSRWPRDWTVSSPPGTRPR